MITGNYSLRMYFFMTFTIISYQMITGNYSTKRLASVVNTIISYQMITGNYSFTEGQLDRS